MEQGTKILRSKNIFTGKGSGLLDGFIVVKENRIETVQPKETLEEYAKGAEKIYDFGESTIMPAFHDAHIHLILGAITEEGGFLRSAASEEGAAKMLAELYRNKADAKWILGGAWDHFKWPGQQLPTKQSLDQYFPDRPVYLMNKECHGAWVNSKTLEYFGISKDTKDPEFGQIYRDEHGEPTGYLLEDAHVEVLKKILAEIPKETLGEYAAAFSKKAHKLGITAVSDMQISGITSYDVYEEMEKRGALDVRVHFTAPFSFSTEKLLSLQKQYQSDLLQFSGVKDFVDGTPMGYTGLMIEPYKDVPDSRGSAAIDLDYLRERIIEVDRAGLRVRLHACGDMAVRVCLDCFEQALHQNGRHGMRHTIEHIEACSPFDVSRFGELGVIASVQPEHLPKYGFAQHPFHAILGEERMRYSWPFGTLAKTGALLGFGTDYPVSELTPFRGLYRAVTRLTDEQEPEGGFSPAEKISLAHALSAYTYGSAYINEREKELGTLEAGKFADIAILTENIFETDPLRLKEVEVAATMFDGQMVYEA